MRQDGEAQTAAVRQALLLRVQPAEGILLRHDRVPGRLVHHRIAIDIHQVLAVLAAPRAEQQGRLTPARGDLKYHRHWPGSPLPGPGGPSRPPGSPAARTASRD